MDDKRRERLDEVMKVVSELHGDTLRALAESERHDRMQEKPWWENLSDEDQEALGCMLHTMRPKED
jgi:hypothetical protein